MLTFTGSEGSQFGGPCSSVIIPELRAMKSYLITERSVDKILFVYFFLLRMLFCGRGDFGRQSQVRVTGFGLEMGLLPQKYRESSDLMSSLSETFK